MMEMEMAKNLLLISAGMHVKIIMVSLMRMMGSSKNSAGRKVKDSRTFMRVMIVNASKARNQNFRKGFWKYNSDGGWMNVISL
jgi:hypothetical protein